MSELTRLIELQNGILRSRHLGERFLRGFWQVSVFFSFLGFVWFFIHRLTHGHSGVDQPAFLAIGGFGAFVIAALMGVDALFFNKIYDKEHDLEQRQTKLAAEVLGVPNSQVSLHYSPTKQYYLLSISKAPNGFFSEKIALATETISLTFHIHTTSLESAIRFLDHDRELIRRQLERTTGEI